MLPVSLAPDNASLAPQAAGPPASLLEISATGCATTLSQVAQFYSRGGNFASNTIADLAAGIQPLGLSASENTSLVVFLKSLTDKLGLKQQGSGRFWCQQCVATPAIQGGGGCRAACTFKTGIALFIISVAVVGA